VPCANTLLVRTSLVVANAYNPNSVPPDKMDLLRRSILDNGFCFPVVVIWDADSGTFVVIDGFHRRTIGGPEWLDFDYVPVVVLDHDITQRMAATLQFNKARGFHQVDLDAEVIRALLEQGSTEEEVAEKIGLDLDTVHRYKQLTGIASLFATTPHSQAWEMVETDGE
jgi:ParB-like chromosome segregation protein Spo0J